MVLAGRCLGSAPAGAKVHSSEEVAHLVGPSPRVVFPFRFAVVVLPSASRSFVERAQAWFSRTDMLVAVLLDPGGTSEVFAHLVLPSEAVEVLPCPSCRTRCIPRTSRAPARTWRSRTSDLAQ